MNAPARVVIGSRGSDLALWQARHVQSLLEQRYPGTEFPIEIMKTQGDRVLDRALHEIGDGKGLFTKELEDALLDGRIDLAVHSLKDLPTTCPPGLCIAAVPEREDPHDVWLGQAGPREIKAGSRVGTSSLRRQAQLRALRSDLEFDDLRGNVPTRLKRLEEGKYAAIVLARAGLFRLGLLPPYARELPFEWMLPAPGQGALGLETRADDGHTRRMVGALNDPEAELTVTAERAFLGRLEGGCIVPVGAHAVLLDEGALVLDGLVAALDGREVFRSQRRVDLPDRGPEAVARDLGLALADDLIARGADRILKEVRDRLR